MFVLGIDPGLSRCGYGLVERTRQGNRAVTHGVLCTPHTDELPVRLAAMHAMLRELVATHRPDVVVVERVFFQTNARTAMGVGQASGLALVVAHDAGCEVVQYTANEVKLGVTGYGGADKGQVQRMVQRILGLEELPRPADAADALALALHHLAVSPALTRRVASGATGAAPAAARAAALRREAASPRSPIGNARIATRLGAAPLGGERTGGTKTGREAS